MSISARLVYQDKQQRETGTRTFDVGRTAVRGKRRHAGVVLQRHPDGMGLLAAVHSRGRRMLLCCGVLVRMCLGLLQGHMSCAVHAVGPRLVEDR